MNGQVHMSREFSDELLSAYLDGELGPEERAAVEQQVAASEADHQLLNELRMLRSELASLPVAALKPDFADRVVQMAIAAAEVPPQGTVVHLPARRLRYWHVGAAVSAIAACALVVVQPWLFDGPGNPDVGVAVGNADDASVEKALVIRLRAKDPQAVAVLESALMEAGIQLREPSDDIPDVSRVRTAYKQQLDARREDGDTTIPALDAMYVQAPLDKLKAALANNQALQIVTGQPLLLPDGPVLGLGSADGEGTEAKANKDAPLSEAYSQRLTASRLHVEKQPQTGAPVSLESADFNKNGKPVRVLILIEPVDSQ
jgi:anti-sigma factor RsiW